MTYQLNQQLELPVRDLRIDTNTGKEYAVVYDDEREYRIYNLLNCQKDSLPEKMYVKVFSEGAFGIRLRQDEGRLFQEHYVVGKLYAFEVKEVKMDHNSDKPYYLLEDDFATHHYYFKGEQKYQVSDDCILEIKGFTDKGFLKLAEVEHQIQEVEKPVEATDNNAESRLQNYWQSLPVMDVEENESLELKTSIVFPPGGNGQANIGKQLYNILKEITAFMNTKGGELLIGIHDKTKKVIGIEGDFSHLNDEDSSDEYAGTYKTDIDGYELKIRNTMDQLCPSVANSLTKIEFPNVEGRVYCKITVTPARRPIFLSETQLWIRQGNRLKRLTGDEITFFITERMTLSIADVIDTDGIQVSGGALDVETLRNVMRNLLNERRITVAPPKPRDLGEVDHWLVWYDDATWKKQRNKSEEANVYKQVAVAKNASDPLLVFCYESGKVNVMKESAFRSGARMNVLQKKNAWSKTGEKPMAIFVAQPSDFIVGFSIDENSIEYVKLHAITDYNVTSTAANQGAPFVPANTKMTMFKIIGAEHRSKVAHLIGTKQKRSADKGTPLNSPAYASEIAFVNSL